MKSAFMLLGLGLVAFLALGGTGRGEGGEGTARQVGAFKITTRRADDAVQIQSGEEGTVFKASSPFGISRAVVERLVNRWPKAVALRLHLKGLSSFHASNGKVTLDAAVSVEGGKVKVRVWKDGKEEDLLDEKSPLWVAVRVVGADGKPARELPVKGGYFEVRLPQAFFAGNPKSITLSWIDFYRG